MKTQPPETTFGTAMKTHLHPRCHWLRPAIGRGLALLLGLGLLGATGTGVRAATRTVTSAADSGAGSLRATIAAAAAGDTIIFAPALNGQTIVLTNEQVVINKSLNILGPGPGLLTIHADANGDITGIAWSMRVFKITSNSTPHTITIAGLTIAGGSPDPLVAGDDHGGGGIFNDGASLTVSNCVLRNNSSVAAKGDFDFRPGQFRFLGSGGGAICNRLGTLTVINCTLTNNWTYNQSVYYGAMGGGIYNQGGVVLITNGVISLNRAAGFAEQDHASGGGVFNRQGVMTLNNCTLVGNRANIPRAQFDPNADGPRGLGSGGAIASRWGVWRHRGDHLDGHRLHALE
jgi:hypothetical protein